MKQGWENVLAPQIAEPPSSKMDLRQLRDRTHCWGQICVLQGLYITLAFGGSFPAAFVMGDAASRGLDPDLTRGSGFLELHLPIQIGPVSSQYSQQPHTATESVVSSTETAESVVSSEETTESVEAAESAVSSPEVAVRILPSGLMGLNGVLDPEPYDESDFWIEDEDVYDDLPAEDHDVEADFFDDVHDEDSYSDMYQDYADLEADYEDFVVEVYGDHVDDVYDNFLGDVYGDD